MTRLRAVTHFGVQARRSIEEYADAVRGRYFRAPKKKKTEILDEFVATTGLHRKAVIRLLNRRNRPPWKKRKGRPKLYDLEVMAALKVGWEATDRLCSKRLQPFLPELIDILKRTGEITVTEETEEKLCNMSSSTIDRILRRWRRKEPRHGISTTKPGTLLKNAIPVRTFSEWDDKKPGFLEADLVAHCGDNAEGFYLTTLSTADVATRWCEPIAVWGKGHDRVGGAVHHVGKLLPMPMLGLDSDNGSEFAKHFEHLCQEEKLVHFFNYPKHPQSNGFLERFNRTIQEQCVNMYLDYLDEPEDFNRKLMDYLIWYNTEKPHRGIGNLSPMRYYLNKFVTPHQSNMLWALT